MTAANPKYNSARRHDTAGGLLSWLLERQQAILGDNSSAVAYRVANGIAIPPRRPRKPEELAAVADATRYVASHRRGDPFAAARARMLMLAGLLGADECKRGVVG